MNWENQRNKKREKACITMSPVLSVLYSQDCQSFGCYLELKLMLTDAGHLVEQCVDDLNSPLRPSKLLNLSRCRASAVVITRGFLKFLETNRDFSHKIACCLRPSATVAFLLGITEWEIRCYHKAVLLSYCSWPRFVINEGDVIPSPVACAIRDVIFGLTGKTSEDEDNKLEMKNTAESLELDEIQQKEETMKNTSTKTTERYSRADEDENLKTRDLLENNTREFTETSTKSEDIRKERTEENSESQEQTGDVEERNASEKSTELPLPLQRKTVVRKRKIMAKSGGLSPQMGEMDDMNKKGEKAINNNSESFQPMKGMNARGKMAKENTDSEKTDHTQEKQDVMENEDLPETSGKTVEVKIRLKKAKDSHKRKRLPKKNQTFETVKSDDTKITYIQSQLLIKGENIQETATEESAKTFEPAFKNDVQEKDCIQERLTKKNTESPRTSGKGDDTQTQSMETENAEPTKSLEELGDCEKKRKNCKNTESSQSDWGKRKTSKNNATLGLPENVDRLSTESFALLETDDATQGNRVKKNPENFQIFKGMCNVQETVATGNTEAFLTDEIMESIEGQEIPTEIVMVPDRVEKDNDCVFIIFTNLLNNLENVYVLLERNILKETPIHLMNPYVVYFFVPEQFLDVEGTVNVHIHHENRLLAVKSLSIMSSAPQAACYGLTISETTYPIQSAPSETFPIFEDGTATQLDNKENNPCVATGDAFQMSEDDAIVAQQENGTDGNEIDDETLPSFLEFFAHYGFGELQDFALELLPDGNSHTGCRKSSEGNICISDDDGSESVTLRETISGKKEVPHRASLELPSVVEGRASELRRSASLPLLSAVSPIGQDIENGTTEETEEENYLEMLPGYRSHTGKRPHEMFLDEVFSRRDSDSGQLASLSSNIYVSMIPKLEEAQDNDATAIDLSKSQQELLELMEAFKSGDKTLSQVEGLFSEWLIRHRDSVDDRDVILRLPNNKATSKKNKGQSFSLIDIMKLRPGKQKPNKKTKTEPQFPDAKVRRKTDAKDKVRERNDKTLSKISNSSGSSVCSICSETYQTGSPGNQAPKRDSGNHSDSNEDNKSKTLPAEKKSTNWFLDPSLTSAMISLSSQTKETPPSLPSRPPPAKEKRPDLPARPRPNLPYHKPRPPILPPKPATLWTGTPPRRIKNKPNDVPERPNRHPRDSSPDYITATNHPRSPPKTRDKFKQAIHPTPSQIRRNNYALEKLGLSTDHPRKISAPEIRSRSKSPRKIPNTPTASHVAASPLSVEKKRHNRYRKPSLADSSRSTSCPDLQKTRNEDENPHTYLELQGDSDHSENASYLHSNKSPGSKSDAPPLPRKP